MENETPNITPENTTNTEKSNKKKKIIIIILIAVVLIIAAILAFYFLVIKDDDKKPEKPETNKAKPKPELNFSADNTSEIYNEINKFMADMPQDMLDKFKDFSDNLSSKLEDVNLADLFNVEVNKVEIKSPVVTKLFQAIARFNETELKDEKIVNKISELTNYLNDYKNGDIDINATTFNDLIDKYFTYYKLFDFKLSKYLL